MGEPADQNRLPPVPNSAEDWYALAQEMPLRSVRIDTETYVLGQLSEPQLAALDAAGLAITRGERSALHDEPLLMVKYLLEAGSADVNWNALRSRISFKHYCLLAREYQRQAAVRAFAASAMAGRA